MTQPAILPSAHAAEPMRPERLAEMVADAAVRHRGLLLCTDFDGSVAPIRSTPGEVHALPGAERALAWLSRRGATAGREARCPTRVALVTARDAEDVARRIVLGPEAVVSGNYGLERISRGRLSVVPQAERWAPALEAAAAEMERALHDGRCPGARLERKHCGVVVHTRGIDRPEAERCALELAQEVAARWKLGVVPGKMVAEIHPPVRRTKADAVRDLRRDRWRSAALCIAGDDMGDIPMLQLAAVTDGGFGVAVGGDEAPGEVMEAARWRLASPEAWAAALTALVDLLRI
ncbi:MAG TPA: trehalose-phosphatase [Candidatus Dormibacteraeota bacterium]|jgi:trehalose 6-phosphate phosphatase|nr:trehalose-phosphatase [Candidatus Dormibacteraeota bacterium]